jgi:hypothetical protein
LSETHTPYSVSVENEAGYVLFEMEGHSEDEHDHEEGSGKMLTFMTQNGSADVERGTLVYRETDEVAACGPMDRYIVVEPDHGEAVVELSTEM